MKNTRNLAKRSWAVRYSRKAPARVVGTAGGLTIAIPGLGGSLNYLVCEDALRLVPGSILTLRVRITLSPGAIIERAPEPGNTCDTPATMRPMLLRSMQGRYGRWWADEAVEIAPGDHRIEIPLMPSRWSSVYGERGDELTKALAGWRSAMAASVTPSLTFGAGCFMVTASE